VLAQVHKVVRVAAADLDIDPDPRWPPAYSSLAVTALPDVISGIRRNAVHARRAPS